MWHSGKESACQCRRCKRCTSSLGQDDPLEKEMVAHSSTLAWKIPWMEDPGRLQSMGSKRVGHESDITFTFKVLDKILFFFNSRRPVS